MADILVNNNFYQSTSNACLVDLTPPTFAGIATMVVHSRGQMRTTWLVATDATNPVRYEIYIKASTATGLFSTANIVGMTDKLQFDTWTLPDGSFLQNGVTYFMGVRAVDAVGNRDANTVSMSVVSTGILTSQDVYECRGAFSVNSSNQFQGTLWVLKNAQIGTGATLGTASYQVYDSDGVAVGGLTESGITANAQGQFIITPVASTLAESLDHYVVKVMITMDSAIREGYVPVIEPQPNYEIEGVSSIDTTNNLVGSFWVTEDEKIVTTGLGTGSYQAFDSSGNLLIGLSESGIVPDVNGIYSVTPFPLPPTIDTSQAYSVRITLTVNGTTRSHFVILPAVDTSYTVKSTFSINALNQLEATFWSTKNDEAVDPALLGTAAYQIYDKTGAAVVGLTQSGIAADLMGLFHTTPVSAVLLTDLTHYTAKIDITVAGQVRTVFKGFTLLGT